MCAGAKSILDLALTKEYLETQGVPIIGYQTDSLPAFYTRESEHGIDYRLDSAQEIALALRAKWEMDLKGGAVIANPIPTEYAMPPEAINRLSTPHSRRRMSKVSSVRNQPPSC